MNHKDSAMMAAALYVEHVIAPGYGPPQTLTELITLVHASGAHLIFCCDAPESVTGLQIGMCIYVNIALLQDECKFMHVLAHEWAHYLRFKKYGIGPRLHLYGPRAERGSRAEEEQIARAFEKLF